MLFVENESCCGPFKCWDKDGMFVIDELKADISNHLNSLKVRKHLNYNSICYYYLIIIIIIVIIIIIIIIAN